MADIATDLRETVRATREARGWSQRELATIAGVSENTVLSLELGERQTQPRKLRRILEALGLADDGADAGRNLGAYPPDVAAFLRDAGGLLSALDSGERATLMLELYHRLIPRPDLPTVRPVPDVEEAPARFRTSERKA